MCDGGRSEDEAPLGIEAAEQVWALARWTERQVGAVQTAREAYDEARA
ncbi:hypothetical protein EES46_06685 [Streptomyces sp. ADI98-10]|nr:hypothetical protein EES46_06685 [Streptomyces sp. ADI98-10]